MNKNIIYQHYNTASMKSYIGLTTKTMDERWKEHLKNAFRTNDDGTWFSDEEFSKAHEEYKAGRQNRTNGYSFNK